MTKKVLYLTLTLLTIDFTLEAKEKPSICGNLWKNTHISWDVYNTNEYRWLNFSIGTDYSENFDFDQKAY